MFYNDGPAGWVRHDLDLASVVAKQWSGAALRLDPSRILPEAGYIAMAESRPVGNRAIRERAGSHDMRTREGPKVLRN